MVDPDWQSKWASIGTDGKCTTTVLFYGAQTRFEEAVEFPIVHVWCGFHHIDLVAQKAYLDLFDDTFMSTLTGLVDFLRHQSRLQIEMKTT